MTSKKLKQYFNFFPFVAIARGIKPADAVSNCTILYEAGFKVIETTLNSPEPYKSIELMAAAFGDRALIGAGTVVAVDQVERVRDAGGGVIISPHCDPKIIEMTKKCGLISIPGVATPTEVMTAIRAGADALKLFPAEIIGLAGLNALKAVIPEDTLLIPVGGIDENNYHSYLLAGATACGLGSSLYKAGMSSDDLKQRAEIFGSRWQADQESLSTV